MVMNPAIGVQVHTTEKNARGSGLCSDVHGLIGGVSASANEAWMWIEALGPGRVKVLRRGECVVTCRDLQARKREGFLLVSAPP